MAHVGFHHRLAARISALTDFAVKLGRVALTLAPSLEQVVFVRIKLTRTQGTRSRQRGSGACRKYLRTVLRARPSSSPILRRLIPAACRSWTRWYNFHLRKRRACDLRWKP